MSRLSTKQRRAARRRNLRIAWRRFWRDMKPVLIPEIIEQITTPNAFLARVRLRMGLR